MSPVTPARPARCCPAPAAAAPLSAAVRRRAVAIFRALGDPTRLEVFRAIAAGAEPICVCDLVARFDVSQPTISHHLKALREAGLVTFERRGVWAHYSADADGVAAARAMLESVLGDSLPAPR